MRGERISHDQMHLPSKYVFIFNLAFLMKIFFVKMLRLVRVKTFVQRTTNEYDDTGRESEHAYTKEGIFI